jgi:hypothetical protein
MISYPAGFSWSIRGKPEFGLCVTDGNTKSAIIFFRSEALNAPLWFAVCGIPDDTLVSFPSAIMRPDWHSLSFDNSYGTDGAIISASGNFYLRVRADFRSYRTFNVKTGKESPMESPNKEAKFPIFTRWQVGRVIDQQFDQIFEFPVKTGCQAESGLAGL